MLNTHKLDVHLTSINKTTNVWEVDKNGNPMDGMGYEGVIRFDFTHLPGLSFVWEPESGMGYFYEERTQSRCSEPMFFEVPHELWESTDYQYELVFPRNDKGLHVKFSGEPLVRNDVDLSDTKYSGIEFGVQFN